MICTTNCTWGLTEVMVGNLTSKLGRSVGNGRYSFPTPAAIAGKTELSLRKEIKSGYRSPYLLELAEAVEAGALDLESWRTSTLPTEDLYRQVLAVKGIGAYAAGNILKLLGRCDYLGLDSWVRKKFSELHKNGRKTKDSTIEKHYKPFGKWKGLFFWLEMTRDWYTEKFPF
jgi:3-methyladenine DNA glycosylase/8-oxoguanine DNA glycosylase